jgi:hypothetical protein
MQHCSHVLQGRHTFTRTTMLPFARVVMPPPLIFIMNPATTMAASNILFLLGRLRRRMWSNSFLSTA